MLLFRLMRRMDVEMSQDSNMSDCVDFMLEVELLEGYGGYAPTALKIF